MTKINGFQLYTYMALDRFATHILAKNFIFAQFYSKQLPPQSVVENLFKHAFSVFLKSSSFPQRGQKCYFS